MKRILLALGVLVCMAGPAHAATATATETAYPLLGIWEVAFEWMATPGGVAAGTTTLSYTGKIAAFYADHKIGASAPASKYDVAVRDTRGVDVAGGMGMDLDVGKFTTASDGDVSIGVPGFALGTPLSLEVDNAGASGAGTVFIWVYQR